MSENWWDLKKKQKNKSVVRKTSIIEKKMEMNAKLKQKIIWKDIELQRLKMLQNPSS